MGSPQVAADIAGRLSERTADLLDSLDPGQRSRATFEFDSRERQVWHYMPIPRSGVARGEMSGEQLAAADALMASGLSEVGHAKASAIVEHESVLQRVEDQWGNRRFDRDPGLYFYSVFGNPGNDAPWGWRLDGHHLSLHYAVVGGRTVATTPCFFGANPAEVKWGPKRGLRILSDEEDLARELYLGLEPRQRALALIYPVAPAEILTRASPRVEIDRRLGLAAGLMNPEQRSKLMSLIGVYVGRQTPELARRALRKIEAEGVDGIHFGWAGGTRAGQGHYYRIHGSSFFVEYDNTQDMANHVHSVWRDVEGDFGFDILKEHYRSHHA